MLERKNYEAEMKMKPKSKNSPTDCPISGCHGKQLKDIRAHLYRTHKDISFEERKTLISNLLTAKEKKNVSDKAPLQLLMEELEMEGEDSNEEKHEHIELPRNEISDSQKMKKIKRLKTDVATEAIDPMPKKKKTQGIKRKGDHLLGNKKKKAKKQQCSTEKDNVNQEDIHTQLTKVQPKPTSDDSIVKKDQTYDLLGSLLPSMMCHPQVRSKETMIGKPSNEVIAHIEGKETMNKTELPTSKGSCKESMSKDNTQTDQDRENDFFEFLSTLDLTDIEEICSGDNCDKTWIEEEIQESSTFPNSPGIIEPSTKYITSVCQGQEDKQSHIADTEPSGITTPVSNEQTKNVIHENTLGITVSDNKQDIEQMEATVSHETDKTAETDNVVATNGSTVHEPPTLFLQQNLYNMRHYTSKHLKEFPTEVSHECRLAGSGLEVPLLQNYLPDLACLLRREFDMSKFTTTCQIWVQLVEGISVVLQLQHIDGAQHLLASLCDSMFRLRQYTMRRVIAMLRITSMSRWQKNKASVGCPHLFGLEFLEFVLNGFIGAKAVKTRARCDKHLLVSVKKKATDACRQFDPVDRADENQTTNMALEWICKGVPQQQLDAVSDWVGGRFNIKVTGKTFVKFKYFADSLASCLNVLRRIFDNRDHHLIGKCMDHISIACALSETRCDGNIRFRLTTT